VPSILCDYQIPLKIKESFYPIAIKPFLSYGSRCWATEYKYVYMRMLWWICNHARKCKIRNEVEWKCNKIERNLMEIICEREDDL